MRGRVTPDQIKRLSDGVKLDDGTTAPARVMIVHESERNSRLTVTIHEGRYRQVRRMCEAVGLAVASLKRTRYGFLDLGELRAGEYRRLTPQEVKQLTGGS